MTNFLTDFFPQKFAELTIMMQISGQEGGEDITNRTVTIAAGTTNVKFTAVSSEPNPFLHLPVQWLLDNGERPLPHMVEQEEYALTFSTIWQTENQEGNYSFSVGNYSASFLLETRGIKKLQKQKPKKGMALVMMIFPPLFL